MTQNGALVHQLAFAHVFNMSDITRDVLCCSRGRSEVLHGQLIKGLEKKRRK
jgi:hypothetical protein